MARLGHNDDRLLTRVIRLSCVAAVVLPIAFFFYIGWRTFALNVGFDFRLVLFVSVMTITGSMFVGLVLTILTSWPLNRRVGGRFFIELLFLLFLVVNVIACGELLILSDEVRFLSEVVENPNGGTYSRPRAWPVDGFNLVYDNGKIVATD